MESHQTQIKKSGTDPRNFRYVCLHNQLECLLVHDKDAKLSSASMDVGVGSVLDPKDTPGLAHFLEHMLFMGTEKYVQTNKYREFVTNNGGY
jgi:secreted Zn-dependent insulinase-like peptidase